MLPEEEPVDPTPVVEACVDAPPTVLLLEVEEVLRLVDGLDPDVPPLLVAWLDPDVPPLLVAWLDPDMPPLLVAWLDPDVPPLLESLEPVVVVTVEATPVVFPMPLPVEAPLELATVELEVLPLKVAPTPPELAPRLLPDPDDVPDPLAVEVAVEVVDSEPLEVERLEAGPASTGMQAPLPSHVPPSQGLPASDPW